MIKLNHPYKCRHCGVPYIIIQGYRINSFLPVELITGEEINDSVFDGSKHKSHLLNCPALQEQWMQVKKRIAEKR
ncbi:MAG: hypothetical protein GYA14_05830 [Ignavibacteria bacterium]|nr:hypothetical protein [Ignavibacteria bacterium]